MKKILLTLITFSMFFSNAIQAETVCEYVDQKLEKKKFKRWVTRQLALYERKNVLTGSVAFNEY